MALSKPKVQIGIPLVVEEQSNLTNFEEYVSTTVDDLFTTPSKPWFTDYKLLDSSRDNKEHPGAKIVESYPLSAIDPPTPDPKYFKLPENVDLSAVQKDAVRLAASRFRQPGERKGFLLGKFNLKN